MDVILVFGSNDIRTAVRAAELFQLGYAPYIICSGGNGKDTTYDKPEAVTFAEEIIKMGVPQQSVITESQSTNTGENILFTRKLIQERGYNFASFIVVQKPYMERRVYATFCKQWPDANFMVTSPQLTFDEYFTDAQFKQEVIQLMVGDLERIREYPKLGFQIPQAIPDSVWRAYEALTALGFTKYKL